MLSKFSFRKILHTIYSIIGRILYFIIINLLYNYLVSNDVLVKMLDNLIPFDNKALSQADSLFVFFKLGESTYAINASHTIEVLKLPMLEYPQKLPMNVVGILNYNNLTINVVNLASVLNLEKFNCSVNSQLIVVKTEEAIFGILADKVIDVLTIPSNEFQTPPYASEDNIIRMLYYKDSDMVSIIDLYAVETILKEARIQDASVPSENILPTDDVSKKILKERSLKLLEKTYNNVLPELYYQDQFILFKLSNNVYCINIRFVKELVSTSNMKITQLPCVPEYISGIINLRGDFVIIVNLSEFLGLKNNEKAEAKKILVFDSKDYKLAILVDDVIGIKSINNDKFIHKSGNKFDKKYTMAEIVEDEVVYNILNVEKIINDERLFINIES